ncbi:hypothetical protein GCM10011588_27310 [Nocardia jinanensis]|uniref:WYL domain-containing protein n=2 Tax=Nocardia jinanensis TaxID=382504 RepID=A0A917RK75_9NOCA|nr:hypothetical protein GCM10011588_27310 [Nocardia jinanensis]
MPPLLVDEEEAVAIAEPAGLVSMRRRWYLVARDRKRDTWRVFRVERVERPLATGIRFTPRPPPAATSAEYVAGHRTDWGTPMFRVSVTIDAPAGEIAGRLGESPGELTALDTGTCRLAGSRDDSPQWPAQRLVGLDVDFRVHDSPELSAALLALAARANAAVGGSLV